MRIGCISDIHANLPALEAVLARLKGDAPDLILSLGDQVNFGPQPREVLDCLNAEGIPMMMGNHELRQNEYLLRRDAALDAVNFAAVRHTQHLLGTTPFRVPLSHRIENVTFAHAAPDDPAFRLHHQEALPALLESLPTPYLVCGHQHDQWSFAQDGRALYVCGSVGMAENRIPGTAQYALADITRGGVQITYALAPYSPAPLRRAFIQNGFAQACPVMSRIVYESMLLNENILFDFFDHVHAVLHESGETQISPSAWQLAARTFAWRTDGAADAFWLA